MSFQGGESVMLLGMLRCLFRFEHRELILDRDTWRERWRFGIEGKDAGGGNRPD